MEILLAHFPEDRGDIRARAYRQTMTRLRTKATVVGKLGRYSLGSCDFH